MSRRSHRWRGAQGSQRPPTGRPPDPRGVRPHRDAPPSQVLAPHGSPIDEVVADELGPREPLEPVAAAPVATPASIAIDLDPIAETRPVAGAQPAPGGVGKPSLAAPQPSPASVVQPSRVVMTAPAAMAAPQPSPPTVAQRSAPDVVTGPLAAGVALGAGPVVAIDAAQVAAMATASSPDIRPHAMSLPVPPEPSHPEPLTPVANEQVGGPPRDVGRADLDGSQGRGDLGDGHQGCTAAQLRRFIKSRSYVPLHELRRRFDLDGDEDDVSPIDVDGRRLFVGLPEREARLLGELLRAGDVGYELLLDPASPLLIGVFPMRPVPRV